MDAGDSVCGVDRVTRSEVCNFNQEVMITEKGNGGIPECEILPSSTKQAVNGSTLSGKLSGLNITERDGIGRSERSGEPVDIDLKRRRRSTEKFATPAKENNNVEPARDKGINHLPSYSFSFKCAERAHKRKEFYLKLQEKLHMKEMERVIMLAKRKEAEEAEIKMLRKSLVIKAKPMPSFYFERSPNQMELKKVLARKAKSPEEGLPDNATDKTTRTGFTGSSGPQFKRPLKRSLPGYPSQKNEPVNASGNPASLIKPPPCMGMVHKAGKTTCRPKEMQKMFQNYRRELH